MTFINFANMYCVSSLLCMRKDAERRYEISLSQLERAGNFSIFVFTMITPEE